MVVCGGHRLAYLQIHSLVYPFANYCNQNYSIVSEKRSESSHLLTLATTSGSEQLHSKIPISAILAKWKIGLLIFSLAKRNSKMYEIRNSICDGIHNLFHRRGICIFFILVAMYWASCKVGNFSSPGTQRVNHQNCTCWSVQSCYGVYVRLMCTAR